MFLIAGPVKPSSPSVAHTGPSPLRLCLKFLQEGHDPVSALEFVAEWGTGDIKRDFQAYVRLMKEGRSIESILEDIAAAHPSPETELLVAAIGARLQTGQFPDLIPEVLAQAETLETRLRDDMAVVIGPGRRWTLGLVWVAILGGAMLVIALPQYSALLESRVGRIVFGAAIALEIVGLLWAGALLRMQARIERELRKP